MNEIKYTVKNPLLNDYYQAQEIRLLALSGKVELESMDTYYEIRESFFKELPQYIIGPERGNMLAQVDMILASPGLSAEDKEYFSLLKNKINNYFADLIDYYKQLENARNILRENLENSFCLIGHTATSTTDIGAIPFEKEYMNVGTHASVVNTILTGKFLDDLPWWYSAILAVILSFAVYFLIQLVQKPLLSMIVGGSALILLLGVGWAFFVATGIYFSLLTPTLSVFFTFILLTFINFLTTAKEKTFIRNAFSRYISSDVINELIVDPSKLELGGVEKHLTAMFTDIKGFSTISEPLTPNHLVKLLNNYLTEMSNIILELHGTIDKYEGDAIMCFFGAPIPLEDHASRACASAIKMKKMERILNEHVLKEKMSPSPLLTRIGVNTGPMTVGNMGTADKMDYTIMGSAVNLASRLEGVNKQYGTWIMISEDTYKETGDKFTVRELDRVRVVGIKKPVRLYELVDEKQFTDATTIEAIEQFHAALRLFEDREWEKARENFKKVQKIKPDDTTAPIYMKRCTDYKRKAPPDSWDGVFNLTKK